MFKSTPAWKAARKLKHKCLAPANVTRSIIGFIRGYRYAKRLPAPNGGSVERSITPLERYFDSHAEGPGLWKWRHYFEIYERHLAHFCGQPVRVLEIGVFGGGSLTMWRDYFGAKCQMYGVDIDPSCRAYETDHITVFIGDQADPALWESVLSTVPEFDVIIDDGGHLAHQQIVTFEALLAHIAPGGVYLCEDIHGAAHPFHSYLDGFMRPLSVLPFPHGYEQFPASSVQQHIASVHRYPLVTVVEKPAHRVTSFEAPRHGTEWPEGRELG